MIEIKEIISLILSIIGIILVLFLTYYGTRWLSTKTSLSLNSKYMKIVDKIILGQNKFLAIAEINNKYYLLSITEKNISILKELEELNIIPEEEASSVDFSSIFKKFLKK